MTISDSGRGGITIQYSRKKGYDNSGFGGEGGMTIQGNGGMTIQNSGERGYDDSEFGGEGV